MKRDINHLYAFETQKYILMHFVPTFSGANKITNIF